MSYKMVEHHLRASDLPPFALRAPDSLDMGSSTATPKPAYPQNWDAWQDVITLLYQMEGKTLSQVQAELEQKYRILST
jgi:hypothetical protein